MLAVLGALKQKAIHAAKRAAQLCGLHSIRLQAGARANRRIFPAYDSWYDGKEFSADWTTMNIKHWANVLRDECDVHAILEIGAMEGRSAIFWLEFFPASVVTCIDNFEGVPELQTPYTRSQVPFREKRFDGNLAPYGARVRKIKSRSAPALDALFYAGESFDLIYIDADHRCDAVLADSALSLRILRPNGILIWDDYQLYDFVDRPGPAIDAVLALHQGKLEVLHKGYQVIARKAHA